MFSCSFPTYHTKNTITCRKHVFIWEINLLATSADYITDPCRCGQHVILIFTQDTEIIWKHPRGSITFSKMMPAGPQSNTFPMHKSVLISLHVHTAITPLCVNVGRPLNPVCIYLYPFCVRKYVEVLLQPLLLHGQYIAVLNLESHDGGNGVFFMGCHWVFVCFNPRSNGSVTNPLPWRPERGPAITSRA